MRCLYRRPGTPTALDGLDVEILRADIRDEAPVQAALEGVDAVYHLAALTRSRTRRAMLETNVGGTCHLLDAARRVGLPGRFLFCSSLAAAGPAFDGRPLEETDPCRPITWYGESKRIAEDHVRARAEALAITIVRPPAVYGPRDRDFLPVFTAAQRGLMPVLGTGRSRLNFVYVEDLAAGIVAAADAEATRGGTYFVTHPQILTAADFAEHVARAVGRSTRALRVPQATLALLAGVGELAGQLTGRAPLLNRERLKDIAAPAWLCSSAALERDAAWRAEVDVGEGTRRTAAWLREQGVLTRTRTHTPAR